MLKILLFHPTLLPPKDYGGVERVVLWLAKALLELGHEVWVGAFPGSQLPKGARLLPIDPNRASARELLTQLPEGIDLVHFMAPPEEGVWEQLPCAGILTVHGNGKRGEIFSKNTVFLSEDHARRHGASEFVYNGIDPDEYIFEPSSKNGRFLFLSKTSWGVKNLQGAMNYCEKARVKLQIAGGNRPLSARFKAALSPRMSWLGPVSGQKKATLLAGSRALVFPVRWPEPFGLVVVEALISGTPVLASRSGSLPELVPGNVGAVMTSEAEWIAVLSEERSRWDPEICRNWALARFTHRSMALNYQKLYARVLGGQTIQEVPPVAKGWRME